MIFVYGLGFTASIIQELKYFIFLMFCLILRWFIPNLNKKYYFFEGNRRNILQKIISWENANFHKLNIQ